MLDTKVVRLSDGTELKLCWTMGAVDRFRDATGVDLLDEGVPNEVRGAALLRRMPAAIHSMILDKAERDKITPADIADLMEMKDSERLVRDVMKAMGRKVADPEAKEAEGQQNGPFVNGKDHSDSVLNSPTP